MSSYLVDNVEKAKALIEDLRAGKHDADTMATALDLISMELTTQLQQGYVETVDAVRDEGLSAEEPVPNVPDAFISYRIGKMREDAQGLVQWSEVRQGRGAMGDDGITLNSFPGRVFSDWLAQWRAHRMPETEDGLFWLVRVVRHIAYR